MNQNLSSVQHGSIPRAHSGVSMRNPFSAHTYDDDVPHTAPFSGVRRATTVQPLSAFNRTSTTRETAWATSSLRQEAPVPYSSQTKGTLFQWDDDSSKPAVIQPQNN